MIPKSIHVTWKDRNVLKSKSPLIVNGIKNLKKLNPDWTLTIHDDTDVDMYLKDVLDKSDYNLIKDTQIVEKSDIWRLFKMYREGGMYVDIDRLCNKNLDYLLQEGVKWILPTCNDYDFSHDLMISEPGNPVYEETINLYLQRRREGNTNVYFLGTQTYMHAITKLIFNEVINTNPGKEKFDWMVNKINEIPFIKLYREEPPYNTILFKAGKKTFNHEDMKRKLYKDSNIKHWTGLW